MARTAYDKLNEAIEELMANAIAKGYVIMDAVLVVGAQCLDEDGDRIGGVGVFMKDGYGPAYTAKGLLVDGLDRLREMPGPRSPLHGEGCAGQGS